MKLFNSLSGIKEEFIPNHKNEVKMYVCGITPYDTTHLGHAFTYSFFDTLQRYLTSLGHTVTYTQNVTDIDDDVLKKAKESGKNWQELGEFWTQKFLNDIQAMNITLPGYYVKATDTIPLIREMVERLEEDGFAYAREGNVYFRIKKFKNYGKLSKYSVPQMILLSKERGADPNDTLKEDPLDFILWQKEKPGEPSWDSKWGKGRPGWHVECSAMNYKYLGERIDIHGGGRDLIYPHHESEIAQSESFTKKEPFSKFWLHTGTVMYQGEKMSKSLGNLVLISDMLKKYSANSIRLLLADHHYRRPWEFDEEEMGKYEKMNDKIRKILTSSEKPSGSSPEKDILQFKASMDDDMNTPQAVRILFGLTEKTDAVSSQEMKQALQQMAYILGLKF